MAALDSANSLAIAGLHRVPFFMSSDDIHGSTVWMTDGSQSRSAKAMRLLVGPDQLKKTFMTVTLFSIYGLYSIASP
jgi:hypothetical protein